MATERIPLDPSRRSDPLDDEIDLREYVVALWRHRLKVALFSLACGAVVWFISGRMPPIYEARARITLLDAPGSPTVAERYRVLLDDPAVATSLLDQLRLGEPPFNLTPALIQSSVMTSSVAASGNEVFIDVRLGDAQLAARAANLAGRRAVELAQLRDQQAASASQQLLAVEADKAERQLAIAQAAFSAYRRDSRIEIARSAVSLFTKQYQDLSTVLMEIQGSTARLKVAEAQLAATQPIITLKRQLSSDPELTELSRAVVTDPVARLKLELNEESPNSRFQDLSAEVLQQRLMLAALEAKRDYLTAATRVANPGGDLAEARLRELETDLTREQRRRDQALEALQRASKDAAASKDAGGIKLQLIEAVAPTTPSSPRVWRNTVVALAAGFLVSVMTVFFAHALPARARPR